MSEIGKHKLTEAIHPTATEAGDDKGGKPVPNHETTAEQTREAAESKEAGNAQDSNRDRMVDIGRGNQQAGRQGQ